jgi:hypothetical protein
MMKSIIKEIQQQNSLMERPGARQKRNPSKKRELPEGTSLRKAPSEALPLVV